MEYQQIYDRGGLQDLINDIKVFDRNMKQIDNLKNESNYKRNRRELLELKENSINLSTVIIKQLQSAAPGRTEKLKYNQLNEHFQENFRRFKCVGHALSDIEWSDIESEQESLSIKINLEPRTDLQYQSKLDLEDSLIRQRERGMEDLDRRLNDIESIFSNIESIVIAQGKDLCQVENNLGSAEGDLRKGKEELLETSKLKKRCRILGIALCGIAIIAIAVSFSSVY